MTGSDREPQPRIVHHDSSEMPTGLVTFLFTDVEGSTKLWEAHPKAMRTALARHDAIMRAAIESNGGLVFKTIGDAFCAAFNHAPSALLAAVDAQRGLSEEPWGETGPLRARMALHSGQTDERDGDYFGPPVNRVARLLATGHGGQILVSDDTRQLLHPEPPGETDLRDMGKHRLKDLARPEHVFQACAPGLPSEFKALRSQPSPYPGVALAAGAGLAGIGSFRVATRGSGESVMSALSPLGLYQGFKALIVELSTENEWLLLAIGVLLFALTVGLTVARWRAARRVLRLRARQLGPVARWAVNQRMIAFTGAAALLVLSAWGYQQYLWRVALPIPDDAIGFALTREASASTVQEGLADALFTQGQARRVVVRELPVKFDARDTAKARGIGERIGAEAVIIYRVDKTSDGKPSYVAYVVFTKPSVGLTVGGATGTPAASTSSPPGGSQSVQVKQGLEVPVLRTETLTELINAAAGIIDYNNDRLRESIKHLEQAMPVQPDAMNTGIVAFYLGNAYSLDGQTQLAKQTLEKAAAFYEAQQQSGVKLGPQDELILVQTYLERGRDAALEAEWDDALSWYDKAVGYRENLLARKEGLERPSDVRATFARLYTHIGDAYRFQGKTEDERFWRERASDEMRALADEADPTDAYPFVQQGAALFFAGDCSRAEQSFTTALSIDPNLFEAYIDAGIVALWQSRPDKAEAYWNAVLELHPDDVSAWSLRASLATLRAYGTTYFDPTYIEQAEAYQREIIRIDPTNIQAHQTLAALTAIRALGLLLDSTALVQGDSLTVAKSQATWPLDVQEAFDLYTIVIDETRIVASELRPGNAGDEAVVADAYRSRGSLWSDELIGGDLMLTAIAHSSVANSTPVAAGATPTARNLEPGIQRVGTQLLADVEQIRLWTDDVFSDPNASRLAMLTAWSARIQALQWEWNWYFYSFYGNDQIRAEALKEEMVQAAKEAVAFVESQPVGGTDELSPIRMIYSQAALTLGLTDPTDPNVNAWLEKAGGVRAQESDERNESSTFYSTYCSEERERVAGDEALATGDLAGAQLHYEAALKANPQHVSALVGLAQSLNRQGDNKGAIEAARQATEANPDDPAGWEMLGHLQLIEGDSNSAASYERYLSILNTYGPQHRMDGVRNALSRLNVALESNATTGAAVLAVLPKFSAFLDGMVDSGRGSYQYPALYATIGKIALFAGDPAAAEPSLSKSIELDPHQPVAHADLVMAVAAQNRDATEQTLAAARETFDPIWNETLDFDGDSIAKMMTDEADAYAGRFPQHIANVEEFKRLFAAERSSRQNELAGITGQSYKSPTFGYGLTWGPDWTVTSVTSSSGFDHVILTNGTSNVEIAGATQLGDLSGCLQLGTNAYQEYEGATDFVAAIGPNGQEYSESGPNSAAVAFTFSLNGQPRVLYMQCRVLQQGVSGVLIAVEVAGDVYQEQRTEVDGVLTKMAGPDGTPFGLHLPTLELTSTVESTPPESEARLSPSASTILV